MQLINTTILFFMFFSIVLTAQEKIISLPKPDKRGGKSLMQALNDRQSNRNFAPKDLSMQDLSNLLWAAFGINRPESGKRTAPSARNWQEIALYVTTSQGVFVYEAENHSLKQVLDEDIRSLAGKQDFVKTAAVNIIYVADLSKLSEVSADDKSLYCGADTGFIAENVYLYCASQDLAVVVRAMIDKDILAKKLNLRPDQRIILSQSVGYPQK